MAIWPPSRTAERGCGQKFRSSAIADGAAEAATIGYQDPDRLSSPEVRSFLSYLATGLAVGASTQNQAFSALLFLFREVLGRNLVGLEDTPRAKRPARLPLVLTRQEVDAVLRRLRGRPWLIASLMYGAGLRLEECLRLRVKDVDFGRRVLVVRDGKGRKDRETVLAQKLIGPLRRPFPTPWSANTPAGLGNRAGNGSFPP